VSRIGLYAIFFVSGMPALLYQIVWQRALFTLYGVNIESITVVVTAFLLGLGLGSLLGGALSKRARLPLLAAFGLMEIGIGLFGFASLTIFDAVGAATLGAASQQVFLLSFGLVLLPTLLMGATLPLLTTHLVRELGNVGRSVGTLYAVNTLGSATACWIAAAWLLDSLGRSGSVRLAAILNVAAGLTALVLHARSGPARPAAPTEPESPRGAGDAGAAEGAALAFPAAVALAALMGMLSLSYEILWARASSFASGGAATAFPLLLSAFLAGIALGSFVSRRFCDRLVRPGRPMSLRALGHFLLLANAAGFLTLPLMIYVAPLTERWTFALLWVAVAAAMLGASLPLLSHVAIRADNRAGARLSYLYFANIVGSSAGGLITGFVLLDRLSLGATSLAVSLAGLGITAGVYLTARLSNLELVLRLGATGLIALAAVGLARPAFDMPYERLQSRARFQPGERFRHVIETRSGVITVDARDVVYGHGIYDGAVSTSLVNDRNLIVRPFALSAFHPAPREVLQIGLSSGSWATVLASHPQLERLTIIEINPGYLDLIARYPQMAPLLRNAKVEVVIDDARRWLARHPERRFDFIVSNTTFHWRAHASSLLSVEYLELVRAHLRPGGVYLYNTTGSEEVERTGATVFPYASRFTNALVVSDSPLTPDRERWRRTLTAYRIGGRPVLDPDDSAERARLEEVVAILDRPSSARGDALWSTVESKDSILRRTAGRRVITDDNLGTEFRQPIPGPLPFEWLNGHLARAWARLHRISLKTPG